MKNIFIVLLVWGVVVGAQAVIVAGGDGTQNTNAPTGGQGWDYVGRIDHATANSGVTYISNNWFITAYHIKSIDKPTAVWLGGTMYSIDSNSWTRLINSTGGDADLIMFRVVGATVPLPGLTVRSTATVDGAGLTMIGNGLNRESDETHWTIDTQTDPWTWTEVSRRQQADLSGYNWAAGATKRWGTNTKEDDFGLAGSDYGTTEMFYTDFDDDSGEAQGATYDSGGGVFFNNGSEWVLAGIMLNVGIYTDQGSKAVYGNFTYIADMQYYASQIESTAAIDDIDEDGLPDGWEYAQSGSSIGVVADVDQDDDGFTGEEEWIADTDPTDLQSFLALAEYTNAAHVIFSSSTNRDFQVQYLENLTNSTWLTEIDWFSATETQTVKAVSSAASNRFYRVRARLR